MRKWTVHDRDGREIYLTEERLNPTTLSPLPGANIFLSRRDVSMKEKPAWLMEWEDRLEDGRVVTYSYDREGDILEIFFKKGGDVALS